MTDTDNYTANWDDARLVNDCVRAFIKANFGNDPTRRGTSVSVRPGRGATSYFNARIRTQIGHEQGNRMAVLEAIDTATKYYAQEIHPKARVIFD